MKRIITAAGTAASIIGLGFSGIWPQYVRVAVIVVGLVCFGVLLYNDYKNGRPNEVVCRSDKDIQQAMIKIIKSQGKVCLMSRDLTWVNSDIENVLTSKASSVVIFAERENEVTKRLCAKGVQVYYYGELGFEPKTRFTVIRYNRDNPQVAIANTLETVRKKGKIKHTIYETRDQGQRQDKWINSLAIDLISLCTLASKQAEQEANE